MDDADVVMDFENVGIEIRSNNIISGSFRLLFDHSSYMVEIVSDSPFVTDLRMPFGHIQEIVKRTITENEVTLLIVLSDSSRLPRLHFTHFPRLQVEHFIEYLIFKGLVFTNLETTNSYLVIPQLVESSPDVFNYTHNETIDIAVHNSILKKLMPVCQCSSENPVTLTEYCSCEDKDTLKTQIFKRGLNRESRPRAWAHILKIIPDTTDEAVLASDWQSKLAEYRSLWRQLQLVTKEQVEQSKDLRDIFNTVEHDVYRTDREYAEFESDDSPNLRLLSRVVKAYGRFNRDTGFVQGMTDLTTPLIFTFITKWEDNDNALFYDGVIRNREETEVFIFWGLVNFMELTQQHRLLSVIGDNQFHVSAKIVSLVKAIHPPIKNILRNEDLCQLAFIFSTLILMFKRDFGIDDLLRLWDSILVSDEPHIFPRYVAASMLVFMYPKLVSCDKSLGGAMQTWEASTEQLSVARVIGLASEIVDYVKTKDPQLRDFVSLLIPEVSDLREFESHYFEIQKF